MGSIRAQESDSTGAARHGFSHASPQQETLQDAAKLYGSKVLAETSAKTLWLLCSEVNSQFNSGKKINTSTDLQ